MEMFKTVALRFLRVFAAGAVSQMLAIAVANHSVASLKDAETWGYTLLVAFVTGGLVALDKAFRYQE